MTIQFQVGIYFFMNEKLKVISWKSNFMKK